MLTVAYVFQAFAYDMTLLLFLPTPLTPPIGEKLRVLNHHVKTHAHTMSELGLQWGHPRKTPSNNKSELGVEAGPPWENQYNQQVRAWVLSRTP